MWARHPWVEKIAWRKAWQITLVFFVCLRIPGQRPRQVMVHGVSKESDVTEAT